MKDFVSPIYEPGDKVWVRNMKVHMDAKKLDPQWNGPCEIVERISTSGRYKVVLPNGAENVHMRNFKPCLAPPDYQGKHCLHFRPRSNCLKPMIISLKRSLIIRLKKANIFGVSVVKDMAPRRTLGSHWKVS